MNEYNENNNAAVENRSTAPEAGTVENKQNGWNKFFAAGYRTRIQISKGDITILNLSLFFSVLSLLLAPWLVVIGFVLMLVLGYKVHVQKNAPEFSDNFQDVAKSAKENVQATVDKVIK